MRVTAARIAWRTGRKCSTTHVHRRPGRSGAYSPPMSIALTLAAAALLVPQQATAPLVLHAAPDGEPTAPGTADAPLEIHAAFDAIERLCRERDGRGAIELVLADGRYRLSQGLALGANVESVTVRGGGPERCVLDGGVEIPVARFARPEDPEEVARLAASARDRIVAATIEDEAVAARLASRTQLTLLVDGAPFLPAHFPNEGYAGLAAEPLVEEVTPPAVPPGKEGYGVRAGHPPFREPGRPDGWLGSLEEPRGAQVGLGKRRDEMAGTWAQWEEGVARVPGRVLIDGFLEANWLQRTQPLVSASAETRTIHLSRALAYGWRWRAADKPFRVFGLLCELDAPGEWHYDPPTRRLFLIPPRPLEEIERITVPVLEGAVRLDGCRDVTLEGVTIEHVAAGRLVEFAGGEGNVVAGCVLRASTAEGARIGGKGQRLVGCDLVDLDRHLSLGGGRRGPALLEPGGNLVENCHLYQRSFRHRRVGVGISGVGNAFRHNLVHGSLGQAVTVRGNDHLLELNELFNIGYDEGDGGAIYAGGDLAGYGVVYRHNFIHHLMHVPGKVERSGIHLDDLQAGATCEGNVFYKSAGKGVFMNGGAGHVVVDNVFVEGFRGVYNVGHGARKTYERQRAIEADPGHDYAGKKEDYVGRVERLIGEGGWRAEPWASRYPRFAQVMDDAGEFGRLWPIRCEVRGNWYAGNAKGDATIWSRVEAPARAKSVLEGDRAVGLDVFRDPSTLDLRFREGVEGAPSIPFERIGLYVDRHRPRRPSPEAYRAAIRKAYEGVPCMPGTTVQFDSARAVEEAPTLER